MKKIIIVISSLAFLVLAGCSKDQITGRVETNPTEPVLLSEANVPVGAIPGVLNIKLSQVPSGMDEIKEMLPELHIINAVPTFPSDPRFAKRHHEAGLDLWFTVSFDERALMTKAARIAVSNDNIQHVDYIVPTVCNAVLPFNDPNLSSQWHYFNDGTQSSQQIKFVKGADINLFGAWPIQSGSENVIVAINDSGIRYDHEDLADAMWINDAEYYGEKGVDDDGNGYVDDIYGYNFCTYDGSSMVGRLIPEDHGTHTAGTVGAVNNNGIGLCGIAGGNGQHKGVRLMSVQTSLSGSKGSYTSSAFVYAADNGAVVSNNSWGFNDPEYRSPSLEEAIKYFIEYAGMDDDGNQVGPIAGGVVCFSAGNDASSTSQYPASLDYVVCVAASAADNKLASYSNYGPWVNITAPGGDLNRMGNKGGVYSTTAGSTSSYESYQGTSMACPHVTGVVALIVSQFQKQGMTADNIVDVLYSSASPKIYDYNPGLKESKSMGIGLVDAEAAVSTGTGFPAPVTEIKTPEVKSNSVVIRWKVPNVEGKPFPKYFNIYIAEESASKYDEIKITTTSEAGQYQSHTIKNLAFETNYKLYLVSESNLGMKSEPSETVTFRTGVNHRPEITPLDGTSLTLKATGKGSLRFIVSDADEHPFDCSLIGDTSGASIKCVEENVLSVNFNAVDMAAGTHSLELVVKDDYSETRQAMTCTVKPNNPPVVKKQIDNIVFNATGASKEFKLSEYFEDPDGDQLTYSIKINQTKNIIDGSISEGTLTVSSRSIGYSEFVVTASDPKGVSAAITVQVLVRDGSREIDLYPVPMSDKLYVRAADSKSGSIKFYNVAGAEVIEENISFSPFSPGVIDVTGLGKGTYTVIVTYNDNEYRQTVAKE